MSRIALRAATAFVALASLSVAAPQQTLWEQVGELRNERYGQSVAWLDDLDGDGVRDFATGAPAWGPPWVLRHGLVRICSGVDGAVLGELRNDDYHDFGWNVANGGDLDGDGHDDVLVGACSDWNAAVFAYGSLSEAKLFELTGNTSTYPIRRYGEGLVSLGDLDGDAVPDFALGAPDYVIGVNRVGRVELRSGATGALLRSRDGGVESNFGADHQIDAAGDFDGDGVGDLFAVEMVPPAPGSSNVNVDVWSGATFANLLHAVISLPATLDSEFHHPCARVAGDVDGDGTVDFVVSMDQRVAGRTARAILMSGASGARIREILGGSAEFGERCGGVGDLDGDGLAEIAVTKGSLSFGRGDLEIYRGSNGSLLRTILADIYPSHAFATALDATIDADGDGIRDLLVGSPPYIDIMAGYFGGPGRVQRRSLLDGSTAFAKDGIRTSHVYRGCAVLVDDVDGDGLLDVVMRTVEQNSIAPYDRLSLRSGADGREIAVSTPPLVDFSGAMIALPDVDGDGFVDVAVAPFDPLATSVEVRSGATLQLLRTLTLSSPVSTPAMTLAAGVQPATGNVELCVGTPFVKVGSSGTYVGRATLFDVATGAKRWQKSGNPTYTSERFGTAIGFIGDVDGDGWGDWAITGPRNGFNGADCGCVRICSGKDGAALHTLFGPVSGHMLGAALATMPDRGGDGVSELLVKSELQNAGYRGQLELLDSATWTPIFTVMGPSGSSNFYPLAIYAPLPDLNGDGFVDFAVAAGGGNRFELRSGIDARLLYWDLMTTGAYTLGWRAAGPPPGQDGVRRKGGGPVMVAWDPEWDELGTNTGRVELIEFDDFYLEMEPPSAPAGSGVQLWLRGGPPGALAAVMLESMNGIPIGAMLKVDFLDADGALPLTAVVPPSLAGDEWSLLGFAIGLNGKLVVSQSTLFTVK